MIDAVLTYHTNPHTCGVAKFNYRLAKELGVPCLPLESREADQSRHPLVSVKPAECPRWPQHFQAFDLFLHGIPKVGTPLYRPGRIFAGNCVIAEAIRPHRPDVIEAFCPSTVEGNPDRGQYRVLAFGMAHKLALEHFQRLKTRLEGEHPDYTVALSTAVHEGSPWDEAIAASIDAMRGIFGEKLRVLGFLGDDALAKELQECDAVAVYFDPAVRENNTTVWAALDAGKTVYTNTDADSPPLDPERYSWASLLKALS